SNLDDQSLLADFLTFRKNLEAMDASTLAPSATAVIAQRIARAIPLPYDQILSFAYAFNAAQRSVDLLPGMRLAVTGGVYELVQISGPTKTRNGYVGSGTEYMYVNRRSDGTLGFDPFTDNIAVMQLASQSGNPNEITGPADLALAGNRYAHFRLVYPPQLDPVTPDTAIGTYNYNSPVLVGANDLATLDQATSAWLSQQSNPPTNSRWLGFSGRAIIVPEIFLTVNGYQSWVAIGSTYVSVLQHQLIVSPYETAAQGLSQIWRLGSIAQLGNPPMIARSVQVVPVGIPTPSG